MTDPTDEARPDRATWLDGYEWALSHLTDPGVLADARRLALAHESAEAAREAPAPFQPDEPHGTDHGGPTPPVAPSPQSPGRASTAALVGQVSAVWALYQDHPDQLVAAIEAILTDWLTGDVSDEMRVDREVCTYLRWHDTNCAIGDATGVCGRYAPCPLHPDFPALALPPAPHPNRCSCGEPGTVPGHHDDHAVIQSDLREIVRALGLGTHARPYSSHEVVQREVLPALRALLAATPAPTEAGDRLYRDREPQPSDGPDYHADHAAWVERQRPTT